MISLFEKQFVVAKDACRVLRASRKECYVVGGAVRDMMRGVPMHDIDIATNALPGEVTEAFTAAGKKVIPLGVKFGTVVVMMDDEPVEITTYRKESAYSDHRHPDDVEFSPSIEDDLSRRDFTINAMAYDPIDDVLKDPHGGKDDITTGTIRAVGDPDARFKEDPLRMYRGCRFLTKIPGSKIHPTTRSAIKRNAMLSRFISNERVRDEILKTLDAPVASTGISCMVDNGLFDHVLPEIVAMKGVEQPKEYHDKDVLGHVLDVVDKVPPGKTRVRLAAMFHDVGKPSRFAKTREKITFHGHDRAGAEMFPGIGERIKLPASDIDRVARMIRHHMLEYDDSWSDAAVRRLVNRVGKDLLDDLLVLNEADYEKKAPGGRTVASKIRARIESMEERNIPVSIGMKDLKINGKDVMNVLGIRPGPEVGRVLNQMLEAVVKDPTLNRKETLVSMVNESLP